MIKHQKQDYNECQLATFAMLTDKTIEEVRILALRIVNKRTWHEFTACVPNQKYWSLIKLICDRLGMPYFMPYSTIPSSNKSPNLSGKGQITIKWTIDTAHAMAFEDGLVYDPNSDGPVTWEEWLAIVPKRYGLTIEKIMVNKL